MGKKPKIELSPAQLRRRGQESFHFFKDGNTYAARANMSPESDQRRMQGLFKAWGNKVRRQRGEDFVTAREESAGGRRLRRRLRESVAKEIREIQEIGRRHAESAMRRLAEIVENPESQDTAAIAAAQVLLDRTYGKASQTNINANLDANGKPTDVTSKELDTRIAKALKRVEDITGGATQAAKSQERPADLRKRDRDPGGSSVH